MGGLGSGNYSRMGKTTVDSQYTVDIRFLKQQKMLYTGAKGTLSWTRGEIKTGSIDYQIEEEGIRLIYKNRSNKEQDWTEIEQLIEFDFTVCNYGGDRTWLLCPNLNCSRRVTCVYGAGTYFLCRHCYNLNYQSQHESHYDRQLSKSHDIRKKLGGKAGIQNPFPDKPKGMHWKTYRKLYQEAMQGESLYLGKLEQQFAHRFQD